MREPTELRRLAKGAIAELDRIEGHAMTPKVAAAALALAARQTKRSIGARGGGAPVRAGAVGDRGR